MLPTSCSKRNVTQVRKMANQEHPPTQADMARKLDMSPRSIGRILKEKIGIKQLRKTKVHGLTAKQAAQRLERGEKFVKFISRRKVKFLFTMDEMMISTEHLTGKKNFYYAGREVVVPASWKKLSVQSWPKTIMLAMGICWRGTSRLYVVPEGSKVNAATFIKLILQPMIRHDIPLLFGDDVKKVVFHMDSAPAHVAKETAQWLSDQGVTFISKEEWMANSPDLAPMDYAINSIFKEILKKKICNSAQQLARICKRQWSKFPLGIIRKALLSWKKRVEMMIENKGYQIEHNL